jgi:putative nucleotidyltransferase with HDIG domain
MKRAKFIEILKSKRFGIKNHQYKLVAILVISSILLTFMLYSGVEYIKNKYKAGEISKKTIIAIKSFRYINVKKTNDILKSKIKNIPDVYIYYPEIKAVLERKIRNAFKKASSFARTHAKNNVNEKLSGNIFNSELGIKLNNNLINEFYFLSYNKNIENYILKIVDDIYKKGIISGHSILNKEINIRNIVTNNSKLIKYPQFFFTLKKVKNFSYYYVQKYLSFLPSNMRNDIYVLVSAVVKPDIVYSKSLTIRKIEDAKKEIHPIYKHIIKGMLLITAGQLITKSKALELNTYEDKFILKNNIPSLIGLFFVVAILLSISYLFPYKFIKKFRTSLDFKNIIFTMIILIISVLAIKIGIIFAAAFSNYFPFINKQDIYYLIPFVFGPMLIRIILNSEVSVVFIAVFSILTAIIFKNNIFFMIYAFSGSFIASYEVFDFSSWGRVIRSGIVTGIANICMVIAFSLVSLNLLNIQNVYSIFFAFSSGILSSIIIIGLIPIFERVFKYTTDFKLLELSSSNHPLLRQLSLIAPGTYQHSIMVATLAEAAADAIDANPLLARVASLYHDIGKINKPNYFIENINNKDNPHDKLSPTMSSLIITSHVKDGNELAKKYDLGDKVTSIIAQHHGNSMIGAFYEKAQKENKDENLSKEIFRYIGKKPQTKEAGIIMLADSVEAISRTLENISPSRLELMVDKTVNRIYNDGQLDECELTLKDLYNIKKAFVKVLNSIFHQRIPYAGRSNIEETEENNTKSNNKYNEYPKKGEAKSKVSPLYR